MEIVLFDVKYGSMLGNAESSIPQFLLQHQAAKAPVVGPFLKWAGGKQGLLGQFKTFFPSQIREYVEPFLGSGAVFFHIASHFNAKRVVLADSNQELIDTYRAVRDNVHEVIRLLEGHKRWHIAQNHREYYQSIRELNPAILGTEEKAARLIYLNKTCFNGLYRVNSAGQFNVPMGRYTNPSIYDQEALIAASRALEGVELVCENFDPLLLDYCKRQASDDAFIYLDPPYVPLSKTANFTAYTKDAFNRNQQELLAKRFHTLDQRGYKLMLSNSCHSDIQSLYSDYRIETVKARRAINSKADKRGSIPEHLILNY